MMRRPVPGILAIRREGAVVTPQAMKLLLPSLAGMAGTGKQDRLSPWQREGEQHHPQLRRAGHAGGPQRSAALLICAAILIPSALGAIPGETNPGGQQAVHLWPRVCYRKSCWSHAISPLDCPWKR